MNNQHLTELKRRSDSKSSDQNRNNSQNLAPPSDSKVNRPHQYHKEKTGRNFRDTEQNEKFEGFSIYTKEPYKPKHKQPSYTEKTEKTYETNKRPNHNDDENTQLRGYKDANNQRQNRQHLPQTDWYEAQGKKPLVKYNPPQATIDVGQIDFMNLNSIAPNQYPVSVPSHVQQNQQPQQSYTQQPQQSYTQQPQQNYTQQPQYMFGQQNNVQQYQNYAQQEQIYVHQQETQNIQKKKLKKTAEVFQAQC